MNIFEKPINKEYVREYLYDLKDDFDGEEWNEDFEELPDVLYQNDTVRISHLSEKNVVECVFLQDDVNVYFAFINIDVSENGLQNALTAISRSDADCAEKFDRICKLIFHKKFDRSLEKIDEYGLSQCRGDRLGVDVFNHNWHIFTSKYKNFISLRCSIPLEVMR